MIKHILLAVSIAALAATPAAAQQKQFTGGDKVPPGHLPPPGMCRIWLEGVPPGQQPAPTDCATAVRNRPANGRVIFGDDYDAKKKKQQDEERDDRRGVRADASNESDDRDRESNNERRGRDAQGVQTIASSQPLPDMMGAVLHGQGRRAADVRRWLGTTNYTPRFTARNGRAPDRVTWVDANGQVMQVWIDSNDDGQADIVELYQRGKLVTRYRP